MESGERDSTQDWEIPRGRGTSLLVELEARVDEAVTIARASEDGVQAVGEVALDAARQARRAAEAAESASRAAAEARDEVGAAQRAPATEGGQGGAVAVPGATELGAAPSGAGGGELAGDATNGRPAARLSGEARMRIFSERCDRVSARLRELGRRPGAPAAASAAEALRRRGD
ncbi:MAG TPA: hypothetical protein VFJ99_03180 [Solirubrobacterales bacterium]|nr:hypothetical protein [Solirubrobacterales bacterium]